MLKVFLKHLRLIIIWGLVIGIISGAVSLVFPMKYSAESQVLIISRDRTGVDPYTQVKSAERIGENLAQVMRTTDFYQKVMESTSQFDRERWNSLSERKQRKMWQKDVVGSMVYGSSLLKITTYSESKDDAKALSDAVTQMVSSRGWEYVGGDVAIKSVNSPLVSNFPTRPNLLMNILVGFVVGVLLAGLWVYRSKRHLFGDF